MTNNAGARVLCLDPHTNLHGGVPGRVDGRAQGDQVADIDRYQEVHPVHPDRHNPLAGVLDRGKRGGLIGQSHDRATMDVAGAVGVDDAHPANQLGARVRWGLGAGRVCWSIRPDPIRVPCAPATLVVPDQITAKEDAMPGLSGRMSTVIKAKISKMLDRAEDPAETLEYSYQKRSSCSRT